MTKEIILNAETFGVEKSKAKQIEKIFVPMIAMLKEMEAEYDEIVEESENGINEEVIEKARKLRLKIARVRIDTEKVRVKEKAAYLVGGRAVDGVSNILKDATTGKEDKLKSIEKHFELKEKERIEKIGKEREVELLKYGMGNTENVNFGEMEESFWVNFLAGIKVAFEAKATNKEDAEKNELKEMVETEEIKAENKKLRSEAFERSKEQQKEKADLKRKQEEKEDAENNEKYIKFLKDNNFDKENMEVRQFENTFTIWEKKASITINKDLDLI